MKMSEGVEWALHCCLNLAWAGASGAIPTTKLAKYYDLPAPYLNKQLQALAKEGLVSSTSGPRGGFRLARSPEDISILDVVTAIEGRTEAFQCRDILDRAPGSPDTGGWQHNCVIAQTMTAAEMEWRQQLAAQSVADLAAKAESRSPGLGDHVREWFDNV